MRWYVSPNITREELSDPLTFADRVRIFEDRVLGWQLRIAKKMLDGADGIGPIPGSGFAALSVVASYPELIWQVVNGGTSNGQSRKAWVEGCAMIFPSIDPSVTGVDKILGDLYRELRCGVHHCGVTGRAVVLSGDFPSPIEIHLDTKIVDVNPHRLCQHFITHFQRFLADLRAQGENSGLGKSFSTFFDTRM